MSSKKLAIDIKFHRPIALFVLPSQGIPKVALAFHQKFCFRRASNSRDIRGQSLQKNLFSA